MVIKRDIYKILHKKLEPGKVLVLYGPRRVGKTYVLENLVKDLEKKGETVNYLKGDNLTIQNSLSSLVPETLINSVGRKTTLLIIDEAQKIPKIGDNLKILVDDFPYLKIIASGSASFDLAQKVGEPLTGRKKTYTLFPVSAKELIETKNLNYYYEALEQHLIYGGYPEIFLKNSLEEKEEYLKNLIVDFLFRDILEIESVKNPKILRDLLSLIAFQVGREVSLTELGGRLEINNKTVARYLDLLEKSFIIINIRGFSRNLRKEVYQNSRWYFYDNGVRNALINNFNPINLRDDVGALWENYIVVERLKKQAYTPILSNNYFWRTYDQKEIDWVEEREGKLFGYEIKWTEKHKKRPPKDWLKTYKNASFGLINKNNYLDFIV